MSLAVAAMGAFGLSSCELESSNNGDLDGYWHLERIDTLENGHSGDYSNQRIFMGCEHRLISIKDVDSNVESFYFRFEQSSDSLFITKAYINHWHQDSGEDGGDIPVEEVTDALRHFGINELPEHFAKEALDGSKLILKSKKLRLQFKKF